MLLLSFPESQVCDKLVRVCNFPSDGPDVVGYLEKMTNTHAYRYRKALAAAVFYLGGMPATFALYGVESGALFQVCNTSVTLIQCSAYGA
jgi:hypothetical protein